MRNSVQELKRIFRIWDLALLTREDPEDIVKIEDAADKIQEALKILGFYTGEVTGKLDEAALKALKEWMMLNNFRNKNGEKMVIYGKESTDF